MRLDERWTRWRRHGPERLAPPLALVLAAFFLMPSGKALNNSYYALVLAPALFMLRRQDWRWLAGQRLWLAAVGLLGYLTVSGLWSAGATASDWWHEAKALPYLLVYLAVVAWVVARRPDTWERLVRVMVLAAAAGTLISVVLFYRHAPWTARLVYFGPVHNPNEAAMMVGVCLLLVLFHILLAARGPWRQAGWLLAALVLVTGIVLTGSRMPLAALLVSAGVGLVLQRRWRLLAGGAAVLALAVAVLATGGHGAERILKRGDSYRLTVWQAVAQRVVQQPWLGEGVLTDDSVDVPACPPQKGEHHIEHPHNIFLATTLYGGLPALGLLLSVLLFAGQAALRLALTGRPVWLLVLLFSVLCMLTDGARLLNSPGGIWLYFWLPVGAVLGDGLRQATGGAAADAWPGPGDRAE